MRKTVLFQYQEIVASAARQAEGFPVPPEGWLRTLRKALGMSGAQLARRLGVSRAQVAQSEKNELSGAVTLRTLQNMAEAMGGRVVYTIVPNESIETLLGRQANEKARQLMSRIDTHMALENQLLDSERHKFELQRLERELLRDMPADFWDNE